jgi:enoyl-CoA hydratase
MSAVGVERTGPVSIITIDRPQVRNALDGPTAAQLVDAFRSFDSDDDTSVAVLWGAGGVFCAGADLRALADDPARANRFDRDGDGPMGPTRLSLTKPVVAAIEGYAVAGGLELALWCDLRIAADSARLGVFNRRWGIPLVDGGTVRLPRLIGHGRALDLILTGRAVGAAEALDIGLVNRVAPTGAALDVAVELAQEIARFPQICLRADRSSVLEQWSLSEEDAMRNEFRYGEAVIESGEATSGAARFAAGRGRHGDFRDI